MLSSTMATLNPDRNNPTPQGWKDFIKSTENGKKLIKVKRKSKRQTYCPVGEKIIKSDCNNRALVFYTGSKTRIGYHILDCSLCQEMINAHIAFLNKPKVEPVRKIVLNSIASVHLRRKGVRMDWIRSRLDNVTGKEKQ